MFAQKALRLPLFCVFALAFGAPAVCAQDVIGDWSGTLSNGPAQLRLVLHITRQPSGVLTATMDSLDQGARGIPFSTATFEKPRLSLHSDVMHGDYDGTLSADGASLSGTWTQGQPSPLAFRRTQPGAAAAVQSSAPSDIDGAWAGTIGGSLRIVFHIASATSGLTATADSPDQNASGIPVPVVTRDGVSLKLGMPGLGAVFEGAISTDKSTIEGTFTQGGGSGPLVLKRTDGKAVAAPARPQEPHRPYPYHEEDVAYENKSAGVKLAATLTVPEGKGPFPGVVLITGSGPQDRDETIAGHRPFLVLADYLTRRGIAVLRADDRGTGKSSGNFAAGTSADFATDAEAGLSYLKTRTEVDPKKLGLIGHSEGGMIAPMVAARNPDVAFIVSMAGPAVRGSELIVSQAAALAEARGENREEVLATADVERKIIEAVLTAKDDAALRVALGTLIPAGAIDDAVETFRSPSYSYMLAYDPAPALQKVKCPVLALDGEKDRQVPAAQNLAAIQKALESGGNRHFEIVQMPGLNHLFQTAPTGSPDEYAGIEETMAPAVLEKIAAWVLKQ